MKRKPILVLDFDGVIHNYRGGWNGARNISDPPVPGAIQFLEKVAEEFEVHIFSSRSDYFLGRTAMKKWLRKWAEKELGESINTDNLLRAIHWPKNKPAALVSIDDRAITFKGNWPELEELLSFKTWNGL